MMAKLSKLAQAYRNLWAIPEGRLVLADIMIRTGVMDNLTTNIDGRVVDVVDATALAVAEGQRRVGVYIARQISSTPADFIEVVRDTRDAVSIFNAAE